MASAPLEILYEDNHLLVINKPVGLPTQGVIEGVPSVVTAAKAYLKRKYKKPGNVYLGVVSRLDALVGGVLVLARTSKAAARLNEQFRARSAHKLYWSVVESPPTPAQGELTDWVKKDERLQKMTVVPRHSAGAQRATLRYRTLASAKSAALLEVELETGRKHQIRLQLANLGTPILGDRKYGSRRTFDGGIALFARSLSIEHPTSSQTLSFVAEPPAVFAPYLPK
ncbi:MAG: RluA family pseudouridine synthase [Pirellulaceae bacterium]|jgi:23S rRNA pseudouridine1911/1915/1917 synthase|nr:RluA family pseudouridine synthase [Pirellulaceae bacterium]